MDQASHHGSSARAEGRENDQAGRRRWVLEERIGNARKARVNQKVRIK